MVKQYRILRYIKSALFIMFGIKIFFLKSFCSKIWFLGNMTKTSVCVCSYFRALVEQFEVQLQQYRQQIEELENHLTTQSSGSHITPQGSAVPIRSVVPNSADSMFNIACVCVNEQIYLWPCRSSTRRLWLWLHNCKRFTRTSRSVCDVFFPGYQITAIFISTTLTFSFKAVIVFD